MKKTIIVTRGVSNSGKSTFAELLKELHPETVVCCADDYFEKDGHYNFDCSKLKEAHGECMEKFIDAVESSVDLIVVANTNTKEFEFERYQLTGVANGYRVIFTVMEKRHNGKNSHGTPNDAVFRQAYNIFDTLKLT